MAARMNSFNTDKQVHFAVEEGDGKTVTSQTEYPDSVASTSVASTSVGDSEKTGFITYTEGICLNSIDAMVDSCVNGIACCFGLPFIMFENKYRSEIVPDEEESNDNVIDKNTYYLDDEDTAMGEDDMGEFKFMALKRSSSPRKHRSISLPTSRGSPFSVSSKNEFERSSSSPPFKEYRIISPNTSKNTFERPSSPLKEHNTSNLISPENSFSRSSSLRKEHHIVNPSNSKTSFRRSATDPPPKTLFLQGAKDNLQSEEFKRAASVNVISVSPKMTEIERKLELMRREHEDQEIEYEYKLELMRREHEDQETEFEHKIERINQEYNKRKSKLSQQYGANQVDEERDDSPTHRSSAAPSREERDEGGKDADSEKATFHMSIAPNHSDTNSVDGPIKLLYSCAEMSASCGSCGSVNDVDRRETLASKLEKLNSCSTDRVCIGKEIVLGQMSTHSKKSAQKSYMGTFNKAGQKHGIGTYTNCKGDKYVGKFKHDQRCGKGTYFYHNGDKYEGDWKHNRRNGKGKFTWKNGDVFKGHFKDCKADGVGKMIKFNPHGKGEVIKGKWKVGKMMT